MLYGPAVHEGGGGAVGRRDPGAFSQLLISPDRPKTQPTQAVTPVLALSLFDLAGRYLTEEEAETHMIRQLQDPKNDSYQEFKHKTRTVARLDTDKLVGALNEHVSNGWAGREGSGHPAVEGYGHALLPVPALVWLAGSRCNLQVHHALSCPACSSPTGARAMLRTEPRTTPRHLSTTSGRRQRSSLWR